MLNIHRFLKVVAYLVLTVTSLTAQQATEDEQKQPPVRAGLLQRYTPKTALPVKAISVRSERDQEVALYLCGPAQPKCLPPQTMEDRAVPVSLEIQPAEGFKVRYGDSRNYHSASKGTADYVGDRRLLFFKVHASGKLPPGEYKLKATLQFREQFRSRETKSVDLDIPVKVVPHNEKVSQAEWPWRSHPGEAFKNVLVGFVAVPFWTGAVIVSGVYCSVTNCKLN